MDVQYLLYAYAIGTTTLCAYLGLTRRSAAQKLSDHRHQVDQWAKGMQQKLTEERIRLQSEVQEEREVAKREQDARMEDCARQTNERMEQHRAKMEELDAGRKALVRDRQKLEEKERLLAGRESECQETFDEKQRLLDVREASLQAAEEALAEKERQGLTYELAWYKVFIIGAAGCGKTSLAKSWQNPMFDPQRGELEGTVYERYDVAIKSHIDEEVRVRRDYRFHIFDFGGEHMVRALDVFRDQRPEVLICVLDLIVRQSPTGESVIVPERTSAQVERFKSFLEFFFRGRGGRNLRQILFVVNKIDSLNLPVEQAARAALELLSGLREYVDKFPGVREKCRWHALSVVNGIGTRRAFGDLLTILPEHILANWSDTPPDVKDED